jgi:MFS family permease
LGKKERKKREPHYVRMRYLAWFFLGLAALGLLVGLVGDIWGGLTYDNVRGWEKNPGKYPWMVGMIGSGAGTVSAFLAAIFATFDKAKLAKNQIVVLVIQGFLVVGIFEVVYALVVSFQRSG